MTDCFDRLPLWARMKLFVPPGHQDWKQCNICHVYKDAAALKKCAACGGVRIRPIYYCSKECQRKDWPLHKQDCKIFKSSGIVQKQPKDDPLKKLIGDWEYVNTRVATWSMKLAYHYNPYIDSSKVIFDMTVDLETHQLLAFSFTPKEDILYHIDALKELQGPAHYWYRIRITFQGKKTRLQSIHRVEPSLWERDLPNDLNFPEWPWIAANLTRAKGYRRWVGEKKWSLLLTAIEVQRKRESGHFNQFTAREMRVGSTLTVDRMDDWYERMSGFDPWGPLLRSGYIEKELCSNEGAA